MNNISLYIYFIYKKKEEKEEEEIKNFVNLNLFDRNKNELIEAWRSVAS